MEKWEINQRIGRKGEKKEDIKEKKKEKKNSRDLHCAMQKQKKNIVQYKRVFWGSCFDYEEDILI